MLKRMTHEITEDQEFFAIFRRLIKNPAFNYQPRIIEREIRIRNYGNFKVIADWQNREICGFEIYKITDTD
jgi:hypothetical protein